MRQQARDAQSQTATHLEYVSACDSLRDEMACGLRSADVRCGESRWIDAMTNHCVGRDRDAMPQTLRHL